MSLESASARKNKRIVEYVIGGFQTAKDAITFGNTTESVIQSRMLKFFPKFKQSIGSPDTKLAITEDWEEATVLKLTFLEIPNQNSAISICDAVRTIVATHEKVHKTSLAVLKEEIREKPQPQFMNRDPEQQMPGLYNLK